VAGVDLSDRTAAVRMHGGPDAAELARLGLDPAGMVDFSVNVNPYGPAAAVAAAARSADMTRYPDPHATAVRRALAERWRTEPGAVLFANGATEILWDLARLLARRRTSTLVVEPTFSELPAALAANGASWTAWRPPILPGLEVDLAAVSEQLAHASFAAVHLAAPTSPVGAPLPASRVAELASRHPDVLVVLDESFLSLSDRHADAELTLPPNVARVRSLTKEHAIPGLRVGYLLARPEIVAEVEAARPAWPTSSPAQAAALAAVREEAFVAESRARLAADREALRRDLLALGLEPLPSIAPYLAFEAKDAAALRRRLLPRGVLVRDCASFGLPRLVRLAARPEPDRSRLAAALREVL
jgi:histidinol-phosphate/aromatic aminotransferase/cobyric acid decarboxylase-like protein